ncbi:MAG: hypothetical protein ACK526_12870 [Planctomyces sp.]
MIRFRSQSEHRDTRRGFVLLLVLVVVMLLSFAVYSFARLTVSEYAATAVSLKNLQKRALADSGIELASLWIHQQKSGAGEVSSEAFLMPKPVSLPGGEAGSIAVIRELPDSSVPLRHGLNDESAKLNLNTLQLDQIHREESRNRLLAIPGLTIQIADSVMDWMDSDDEVSGLGAETSWYTAQSPPRRPRQGPLRDLSELLLIRGMTKDLFYGEDRNANGRLDPQENDGDRSLPRDNADGKLQAGLRDYLTVLSCEGCVLSDGRRKININQPVLAQLYDQVHAVLGAEAARYIVAWRMRGATYLDEPRPDEGQDAEQRRLERLESVQKRLEAQLGASDAPGQSLSRNEIRRGGIVLSDGPLKFRSVLDLFGGQVQISVDNRDTLLQSPWPADPATLRRVMPDLTTLLTTTEMSVLPGRININEAPLPVLMAVPGFSRTLAQSIVRLQREISVSRSDEFSTVAWLSGRGLMSVAELRAAGQWINTGGHVRGGIAVGQMKRSPSMSSVQFLLDCSGAQTRVLLMADLPMMPSVTSDSLR